MDPILVVAWTGNALLALCAVPQAWKCYNEGHATGMSTGFLSMWSAGEILTFIYTIHLMDWPLMLNYATNAVLIAIMFRYKIWPRKPLNLSTELV